MSLLIQQTLSRGGSVAFLHFDMRTTLLQVIHRYEENRGGSSMYEANQLSDIFGPSEPTEKTLSGSIVVRRLSECAHVDCLLFRQIFWVC